MAVSIHNLIAAISPNVYCDKGKDGKLREEIKKIVKESLAKGDKDAYLKAAKKAKPVGSSFFDEDLSNMGFSDAFNKEGLKSSVEQRKLEYDAFGESLEPVYFWLLDRLTGEFNKVEKLSDNFVASPGSGYYSEMSGKATHMQNEAFRLFGAVATVMRGIINLVYDLKEMKIVLDAYEKYKNGSGEDKKTALLSLKQRWMDLVDIKRGGGSINGLAQQLDFVTIRDAFMFIESLEKVDEFDLNERVKRILKQKIAEFYKWVEESDKELHKRYEIEKLYLKSQVNSLKLYARWAKPYLKAAKALEQNLEPSAALVTTFNSVLLELMLVAFAEYDPAKDSGLPKSLFENAGKRVYSSLLIVDFKFRSMPERISQGQQGGYGFRGKVEVEFTSYALNEQEIKVLKDQLERDDFGDIAGSIEGATDESLAQIQGDIDELLGEKKKEKEEKKIEDTNPFEALFSGLFDFLKPKKKESGEFKVTDEIKKDDELEEVIRSQAIMVARKKCSDLYTSYKKAHGMVTPN